MTHFDNIKLERLITVRKIEYPICANFINNIGQVTSNEIKDMHDIPIKWYSFVTTMHNSDIYNDFWVLMPIIQQHGMQIYSGLFVDNNNTFYMRACIFTNMPYKIIMTLKYFFFGL